MAFLNASIYSCCKLEIAWAYCGWTFEDSLTNFVTFSFAASNIWDTLTDAVALVPAAVAVVVLSFDLLFSDDILIPFIRPSFYIYIGIKWCIKPIIGGKILDKPNFASINSPALRII
jgi:hypothetical protein